MKSTKNTKLIESRYKHKTKLYIFLISAALASVNYLLAVIFSDGHAKVYLFVTWQLFWWFMYSYSKHLIKDGIIPQKTPTRIFAIGISINAAFLAVGQLITRWLTDLRFADPFWKIFASDMVAAVLIGGIYFYFRTHQHNAKRRKQEMKTYEVLGKRLVLNLRSMENWSSIRLESEYLYPGLIDEIKKNGDFPDIYIRMIVYNKFDFSAAKIMQIEGITRQTMRKRNERMRDKVRQETGMELSDFLQKLG